MELQGILTFQGFLQRMADIAVLHKSIIPNSEGGFEVEEEKLPERIDVSRYSEQIKWMRDSGFVDEQEVIEALVSNQGNIEAAMSAILDKTIPKEKLALNHAGMQEHELEKQRMA